MGYLFFRIVSSFLEESPGRMDLFSSSQISLAAVPRDRFDVLRLKLRSQTFGSFNEAQTSHLLAGSPRTGNNTTPLTKTNLDVYGF